MVVKCLFRWSQHPGGFVLFAVLVTGTQGSARVRQVLCALSGTPHSCLMFATERAAFVFFFQSLKYKSFLELLFSCIFISNYCVWDINVEDLKNIFSLYIYIYLPALLVGCINGVF